MKDVTKVTTGSPSSLGASDPPEYTLGYEWQVALCNLQTRLQELKREKQWWNWKGDPKRVKATEELVIAAMRRLASIHPDPAIQGEWNERADKFSTGEEKEKEGIAEGVGKGVAILLVTPFALAGGAVFAAGAMVYGIGKIVVGLGNVLTLGCLSK